MNDHLVRIDRYGPGDQPISGAWRSAFHHESGQLVFREELAADGKRVSNERGYALAKFTHYSDEDECAFFDIDERPIVRTDGIHRILRRHEGARLQEVAFFDVAQAEVTTLARNTWRNVLGMYCMEAVSERLDVKDPLRLEIGALLENEGFGKVDSNNRFIGQIERILIRIAEAGLEAQVPTPLGLTSRQRQVANTFPSSPEAEALLVQCSQRCEGTVLICVDGFDSIVDHTAESRKAIFAGLIDAIQKSSRDPLLAKTFCFKAFLPQELADDAHASLWDSDKHLLHTHYLRWVESDFQAFLKRRLLPYSRTKSGHFADVWHECMPEKIRNDTHKIDELSFNYILRHTLYRPRQVLTHIQKILDKWDEVSEAVRVDPTFIPQVVAATNYDLARSVVNQLEIKHPGLGIFMQSWNGLDSTMPVGEFKERVRRLFGLQSPQEVGPIFDDFFNFGIFGIAPRSQVSKQAQRTAFKFGFVGDRMLRNVHATVEASDFLAIGPMFHEYCGSAPSAYGAVIPIA